MGSGSGGSAVNRFSPTGSPTEGHTHPMQPADFGLLTPAWAATPAATTASDAAFAQAMLDIEAAWARVQASAGLCTAEDASAITAIARVELYDLAALAERGPDGANALIPLLGMMRKQLADSGGTRGRLRRAAPRGHQPGRDRQRPAADGGPHPHDDPGRCPPGRNRTRAAGHRARHDPGRRPLADPARAAHHVRAARRELAVGTHRLRPQPGSRSPCRCSGAARWEPSPP